MISVLFPIYKLYWENTQPENMCDVVFEKTKCCGGTVNRMSFYAEAAVWKGSLKNGVMKNITEFTRKNLWQNVVFDKVKLCRSATSLKTSL